MKNYIGKSIAANYFRGIEAVGGKIHFDETGLKFSSHSLNIQKGETRIEYDEIDKISKFNSLKIIPNGISIFTHDNHEHKFVIYRRSSVIEFLNNKINNQ